MCDYVCVCIYVFSCMRCFLFGGLLLDPAWRNWPFRAFPVLPTRSKLLCELVSAWNEHIWFFCCVFILSHVSAGWCLVVITGILFFCLFLSLLHPSWRYFWTLFPASAFYQQEVPLPSQGSSPCWIPRLSNCSNMLVYLQTCHDSKVLPGWVVSFSSPYI